MSSSRFVTGRVPLIIFGMAIAFLSPCLTASAQQPPTPVLANPNWCSDVPASPPPPSKFTAAQWTSIRQRCTASTARDDICRDVCEAARELWQRAKAGQHHAECESELVFRCASLSASTAHGASLGRDEESVYQHRSWK